MKTIHARSGSNVFGKVLCLILTLAAFAFPARIELSTWTIVAADPKSGEVGVAGATCLPQQHADAVAVLVPGKGAAAVQAFWDLPNRNNVYALLREGESAGDIIRRVTDPNYDSQAGDRQYGVVTLKSGVVDVDAFTGDDAIFWAGSQQDRAAAVTVQGNILASPEVVHNALQAFKAAGKLEDRLMAALEAGSAAGGDTRCNNDRVRQTAASAFILVAHGGDAPYTAIDLGKTDDGSGRGPWLDISVVEPQFGPNPVKELRRRFERWKPRGRRKGS